VTKRTVGVFGGTAAFWRAAALLLVVAVAVAATACSKEEQSKGPKGDRAAPVSAAQAVRRDAPMSIRAVGNVEPLATVAVKSQVGGMIVEQFIKDGQDVKAGDKLFQIDPRPYQLAIEENQAKIARDQALLDKAERDLKRYAELRQKGAVDEAQYDETFAQAKTLEGTIRLNTADLDKARLDLEFSTIKAPIDGRVGSILLHKGNVIKANDDRSMAVINQFQPIFVSFSVPERHLPAVMDMFGKGKVKVEAEIQGLESKPETGELFAVDNAVDTQTGAIRLKAIFDNKDMRLWPGRFVRINLVMPPMKDAILIPTQAVMTGIKGPFVYVIGEGDKVEARNIETGPIVGDMTIVEKGIAEGERVVREGQLRLAPGSKVEIKAPGGKEGAQDGSKNAGATGEKDGGKPAAGGQDKKSGEGAQ